MWFWQFLHSAFQHFIICYSCFGLLLCFCPDCEHILEHGLCSRVGTAPSSSPLQWGKNTQTHTHTVTHMFPLLSCFQCTTVDLDSARPESPVQRWYALASDTDSQQEVAALSLSRGLRECGLMMVDACGLMITICCAVQWSNQAPTWTPLDTIGTNKKNVMSSAVNKIKQRCAIMCPPMFKEVQYISIFMHLNTAYQRCLYLFVGK